MTANTPEAMGEGELPKLTAAYMDACKGKPADHNEIGLHYFMAGWDAGRANLPLPQGDADKVDAERYRFLESLGTVETRWRDAQEINFEWPRDTELSAAIDAAIAARQTPGGQSE